MTPRKILLVDDDPALREMITEALEGRGFDVRPCGDAAAAGASFEKEIPDLILLDVMMPGEDGFSFCRRLREGKGSGVPVIFITAKGDLESRLKGFELGGRDYLQKPFSLAELSARVEVQLDLVREKREAWSRIDELSLRERARRDMADMIVHDLKHPLSCIQGTMALLRGSGLIGDERNARLLETSETMADMMLLMINDILDIARSETAGLKVVDSKLVVGELFRKLEALFKPSTKAADLVFREGGGARPGRRTDAQLVFRILANLIANALKMSPEGSRVVVEYGEPGGAMRLSVTDSGPGLDDAEKERVFGKFARGEGQSGAGSGVGLAFCRVAAEALGGEVRAEDPEGGGCRFVLEIP